MSFQCEYCDSIFKTKYNLNTHQKSAKFCINKREVQENDHHKCEYCLKTYTTKYSLDLHLTKCIKKSDYSYNLLLKEETEKIKKQYEEIFKQYQEIIKEKEKIIEKQESEIKDYKAQINDLAKTAINKPTSITNTNTNKNNTIKNVDARTVNMVPLESIKDGLKEKVEKNFTMNHLMRGQIGVAQFLVDHLLITDDKKFLFKCIDPSRKTFCYLDMDGNIVKDINAVNLTNMIHEPIKERTIELYNKVQERLNQVYQDTPGDLEDDSPQLDSLKEEQEKAMYATEKASDITNIKNNNSEMVRHLIPPLTVK